VGVEVEMGCETGTCELTTFVYVQVYECMA
jgi:hypothetical protein